MLILYSDGEKALEEAKATNKDNKYRSLVLDITNDKSVDDFFGHLTK